MALPHIKVTVTDQRVQIVAPGKEAPPPNRSLGRSQVLVYNAGAGTIYVGDATVTAASGFPLAQGAGVSFAPFGPNDELYAVCAAAQSADVRILRHDPEY